MHTVGKAIDFYIDGFPMDQLYELARGISNGGVGLYPNFIHIDSGPRRSWMIWVKSIQWGPTTFRHQPLTSFTTTQIQKFHTKHRPQYSNTLIASDISLIFDSIVIRCSCIYYRISWHILVIHKNPFKLSKYRFWRSFFDNYCINFAS